MRELVPGIWHWSTFHQPIRAPVSSYYIAPAGIVIDPKVPEGGLDALVDKPQQVVLTTGLHDRDAQRLADEFEIPIRVSPEAAQRLGDEFEVELFQHGDEIAPGVSSIHIGVLCPDEEALHIAVDGGAIAFADGLVHYADTLAFVPDRLLGDDPERVKAGLVDSFRGLLTREFDHLLFAHGDPLVGGGKTALREFVESH